MKEIFFNELKHWYLNTKGKRYTSSTQFVEQFIIPFEETEEFWLIYKAMQYLSDLDRSKINKYSKELDDKIGKRIFTLQQFKRLQSYALGECNKDDKVLISVFTINEKIEIIRAVHLIKNHWETTNSHSKVKGTAFHLMMEKKQLIDKVYKYKGENIPVYSEDMDYDLKNLIPSTYVELRLWNHFFEIAGTSDQVIVKSNRRIIIRDWKTNQEIKTDNKYQLMKRPIMHLSDCNFNHYNLQLSLYAWMLEQFGYIVEHIEFEHFELKEVKPLEWEIINSTVYPLKYLKKEIELMLNFKKYGHNDF